MCQYSCHDGFANDWHLVHLGSRAVGGAALVTVEATAVEERGRISPDDMGIWKDEHIEPLARIARFVKEHGATPAIQLAHAGRKASTAAPFKGGRPLAAEQGAWQTVGPSSLPFAAGYDTPWELSVSEIPTVIEAFALAAKRALAAGFYIVEIHGAHGYLIHEFYSPLSNHRTDSYGGSFSNRIRFAVEVIEAIRAVWPEHLPIFMRISSSDWVEGGWSAEDSVKLALEAKRRGVDLIDCSSGGNVAKANIPLGPGYQVQFAEKIRQEAGILTGAVGMITEPAQADAIIRQGQADLVLLAREFLREPYWPIKAAKELGVPIHVPDQYARAFPAAG